MIQEHLLDRTSRSNTAKYNVEKNQVKLEIEHKQFEKQNVSLLLKNCAIKNETKTLFLNIKKA